MYKNRYIAYLRKKYPPLPLRIEGPKEYGVINSSLITEIIQAYKRKLIIDNLSEFNKKYLSSKVVEKVSTGILFVNYDYLPESIKIPNFESEEYIINTQSYPSAEEYIKTKNLIFENKELTITSKSSPIIDYRNKLITYLELYDLNELINKKIIQGVKVLNLVVYERIKKDLLSKINNYLDTSYVSINSTYFRKAMYTLTSFQGNSLTEVIQHITENFPREFVSQNKIIDFYGFDLFEKMYQSTDPEDFYDSHIIRNFNYLIKENTVPGMAPYRKLRVIFNEKTGKFGDNNYDGTMFDVHMLDKNPNTLEPMDLSKVCMERDPRTGNWLPVTRTVQRRGQYPFILRYIGTNQVGESNKVWLEVPRSAIKMYEINYDSCSRFKKKDECYGPGLNNSTCEFVGGKCQANYSKPFSSFGKKVVRIKLRKDNSGVKYSLSMSQLSRRKAINARIKIEAKKLKSIKKGAVAVKKRFVVLRTFNKKNSKKVKVLNSDINYITKKYLT